MSLLRPHPPRPLLVMSLPRSGSSWVGEALGSTRGALYLREPLNQVHLAQHGSGTLIEVDPAAPPESYVDAARRAFGRSPAFPEQTAIVQQPERWKGRAQRSGRLVIKEVNPLALSWIIAEFAPRVILLVRHPAAVALSFRRIGWWDPEDDTDERWRWYGTRQAEILRRALDALSDHDAGRVILYEDLCEDPPGRLAELSAFAQLRWTRSDHDRAVARSRGGDRGDTFDTQRDSRALAAAWRHEIQPEQLEALLDGWRAFDLPWYRQVSSPPA